MHATWMANGLAEQRRKSPTRSPKPAVGAAARAAAAGVVHAVRGRGRSLTDALANMPALDDERDRPLVQELSFGTLRVLPRLEAVADMLLHKPLKPEDGDLVCLLLVGLYQLTATRIPARAAVASTVEASRVLGKGWAANLLNALMRRFQRERDELLARADHSPSVQWLFPGWLLKRLRAAWPEHWQTIVAASNTQAPLTLRINPRTTTRARYTRALAAVGVTSRPAPHAPEALVLDGPVPVRRLPGFDAGQVSVQDAGAQLAARLLGATAGERVLDACAAPGGKTAHILELADNDLRLTAIDSDPNRLERVRENLARLKLGARVIQGDAGAPSPEWADAPFDRILLDVPCSATGAIRRHPDIKWLRRDTDIAALSKLQTHLLETLWPLLSPGGALVYATCSLLPEENEHQITAFLSRHPDARAFTIDATWGIARHPGRQTLPSEGGMDGFYYARLGKAAA